jgi:hypothetical protein
VLKFVQSQNPFEVFIYSFQVFQIKCTLKLFTGTYYVNYNFLEGGVCKISFVHHSAESFSSAGPALSIEKVSQDDIFHAINLNFKSASIVIYQLLKYFSQLACGISQSG